MAETLIRQKLVRQGNAHGFSPHQRPRGAPLVTGGKEPVAPREALLAAAARAVLASFRDSLEQRALGGPQTAALRLLESALDPYFPPTR